MSRPHDAIGLCANCSHLRVVQSARGSRFVLCRLHTAASGLPRYPRLPVIRCEGHQPQAAPPAPHT